MKVSTADVPQVVETYLKLEEADKTQPADSRAK